MATICPAIIAPVTIYSLLNLMQKLEKNRQRLQQLNQELVKASNKIEQLSGLLPICSICRKVRDDKGYWSQLEAYIIANSKTDFSHGYCPDCLKKEMERLHPLH